MRGLRTLRGGAGAARIGGSAAQFALTLLIARVTAPEQAATMLVMVAWVQVGGAALAWGHPLVVLREASAALHEGRPVDLRRHLAWIAAAGVLVTVAAAALTGMGPLSPMTPAQAVATAASAALVAVAKVPSHALKAAGREAMATALEFITVPAILIAALLAGRAVGTPVGTTAFATVLLAGAALTALLLFATWRRFRRAGGADGGATPRALRDRGSLDGLHWLGVAATLGMLAAHLPAMAAPWLLPEADVAAFIVAFRLAGLATTILGALANHYSPPLARALAAGEGDRARRVLDRSQVIGAACAAVMLVTIPVAEPLLRLFGESYQGAAGVYAVLIVGQAVNLVTGLGSYVLSLARAERALLGLRAVGLALLGLAWAIAVPRADDASMAYGAAYAVYLAVLNLAIQVAARRRLRALAQAPTVTPIQEPSP